MHISLDALAVLFHRNLKEFDALRKVFIKIVIWAVHHGYTHKFFVIELIEKVKYFLLIYKLFSCSVEYYFLFRRWLSLSSVRCAWCKVSHTKIENLTIQTRIYARTHTMWIWNMRWLQRRNNNNKINFIELNEDETKRATYAHTTENKCWHSVDALVEY